MEKPLKIDRFRKMADKMLRDAEAKLAPRETHTDKKLAQARNAEREGTQLQRAAAVIEAYCDAVGSGTLPEMLVRIKPTKSLFLDAVSKKGTRISNGYHSYLVDTDEYHRDAPVFVALRSLTDVPDEIPEDVALRRLIDGVRNVDIPGFWPTPPAVIANMIDRADLESGHVVLEPSAGLGDILDAVSETTNHVHYCEINPQLAKIVETKGYGAPLCADFLELSGRTFDRILMNPPFERSQDIDHVRHAYSLLKPGGRLVAIMSSGSFSGSRRKQQEFQGWVADCGEWEALEPRAFSARESFRKTGVSCNIVNLERPVESTLMDDAEGGQMQLHDNAIMSRYGDGG